ncbi:hypothetical protein DRQ09_06830 [candidate division KSB1 bacterium]|nr:MAG: hypothetical protein DRQ09_06830 [candidate division KSB1 bacterium]
MIKKIFLLIIIFISCSKPEPVITVKEEARIFNKIKTDTKVYCTEISFNRERTEAFLTVLNKQNKKDIWYTHKNKNIWAKPVPLPLILLLMIFLPALHLMKLFCIFHPQERVVSGNLIYGGWKKLKMDGLNR